MIATAIFVISLLALAQFFISYCRSLVAVYSKVEVSAQALEMAGLSGAEVRGDEFRRLMWLLKVCPDPGDDRTELLAVRAYYGVLSLLRELSGLAPSIAAWVDGERRGCAYFAVVALDRRLAPNSHSTL